MLERLAYSGISEVILLDIQRRMHPSIAEFSTFHVYRGKLRNAGKTNIVPNNFSVLNNCAIT